MTSGEIMHSSPAEQLTIDALIDGVWVEAHVRMQVGTDHPMTLVHLLDGRAGMGLEVVTSDHLRPHRDIA